VTQKVPADFPTNPEVLSYRLDLARMASSDAQPAAGAGASGAPGGAPSGGREGGDGRGAVAREVGCAAQPPR
jgi:hypothetical protein